MKHLKKTLADRVFDAFDIALMIVLLVIFAWPLWFVIIASISDPDLVVSGKVLFIPKGIQFGGYEMVFEYKQIWTGYANTMFYTVVGTLCSMILSICLAYPMSEKTFAPRKFLMAFFMFTMYFGGGLIPSYLIYKNLGILDTRVAMIFPGLISVYNCLIMRSYFMNSIPGELKEAATLDGANAASYLVKVVLPLSKPVFAVIGLYYAVAYWNNYTKGLYYIYDRALLPLQNILRSLLLSAEMMTELMEDPALAEQAYAQSQAMKYGVIIVAALPMMILYPFIQKHFVKGVMVGAVKG